MRSERNTISKQISELKKYGKSSKSELRKAKEIPGKIEKMQQRRKHLEGEIKECLSKIPNLMHKSVPIGKGEKDNKVVRRVGKIPKFKFPVKNHVQLAEDLDLVDFNVSGKVSGNGFYYLKGDLALLNQALIRFALEFMQSKNYDYIETPLMLHEKEIYASMDKKSIKESVYSIEGEDLNLIGTAEQSLLAMHSDKTFKQSELPKKYFSYSMCFRKEIGSHGINEKGLWRTHQFNKVEQFIFCSPEDSDKFFIELLKNSEEILKKLKLPYRVLEMCSGDLSDWKHKSIDLEVYRPTIKSYGEIGSLSNCTDVQARELGIRLVDKKGKRILHTLNNTALATSRIMVAILENNQEKDGSIKIPSALWKYMLGKKKIKKG